MLICLSIVGPKIGYLGSKGQANGIAEKRALRNNGGWATAVLHTRGLPEGNRKTSSWIISWRTFFNMRYQIYKQENVYACILLNVISLLFSQVELMPGVVRLLDHLSLCKIPMALATSSSKEYLSLKTSKKHADIFRSKGNNFQGIKTRNQGNNLDDI